MQKRIPCHIDKVTTNVYVNPPPPLPFHNHIYELIKT